MPNWCFNRVSIRGRRQSVEDFARSVVGVDSQFEFERILPTPPQLLLSPAPFVGSETDTADRVARYGAADWYRWRLLNWGTKWHAVGVEKVRRRGGLLYCFDTAWDPPVGVYLTLLERFPSVRISWRWHGEERSQFERLSEADARAMASLRAAFYSALDRRLYGINA